MQSQPFDHSQETGVKENISIWIKKNGGYLAIVCGHIGYLMLQLSLVHYSNLDLEDYVLPWYTILKSTGISAIATSFSNYSPPYQYLLWAVSRLGIQSDLLSIKLISIAASYIAALFVFIIVLQVYHKKTVAWLAYFAALFAPTVWMNAARWGQVDILYTTILLGSLLSFIKKKPSLAMAAFGLALAVKLQAVFLGPFILGLFFAGQINWRSIAIALICYLSAWLPAIICGLPIKSLIDIYLMQYSYYSGSLSMLAGNWYVFFPHIGYQSGLLIGFGLALLFGLAVAWLVYKQRDTLTTEAITRLATLSLMVVPFLLPKMHNRYFFAADVFTIVVAFVNPHLYFLPILIQAASLITYTPFLVGAWVFPLWLAATFNLLIIIILVASIINPNFLMRKNRLVQAIPPP